MSENVEVYEAGPSSGASTPRHGASPSPAQDLQWYEYDLQLAAELGKALLERNQDLETQLAEAEETMQTQQTEIQFLVQKLESAKNLNETRMRIYEQVDNNAQDLEASNRQLRHQLSVEQQTINRLSHSLKEAESRCEKLENDIYDMKRELAEETKRFRDKWRDAKKKERRTSNESMESDVDADDFILLGDAVRSDVSREERKNQFPSVSRAEDDGKGDEAGKCEEEDARQMADSLQWYQAETEKLTKQLLAVEKKLAVLSAEYRSDICLKMEENKSLTMMLEMMRSKQLNRVNSSEEERRRGDDEIHTQKAPSSSSSQPLDASASDGALNKGRQLPDSPSPTVEVVGWSGERRHLGIESGTPTTPTPTSSSCCSSGKVTRNVSFGEVTSLSSTADAPQSDEDDSPKRQSDDVPEVVRRSIEGKTARRRLADVGGDGRKRRPSADSRDDVAVGAASSHCRHCGADLSNLCINCQTKRISLDYEVDEGVVRAVDDLPLRASYRVAKLRDGACAYGSQNTLDRIGGADMQPTGSRRGSVSLMSEIGAQYYRLVEKYESLLLRRTESLLGQLTETEEGESEEGEAESVYFAETDLEKSVEAENNAADGSQARGDAASDPSSDGIQVASTPSRSEALAKMENEDLPICGTCQTLGDFFADISFHNVFFCAIFVYSLPKFALMSLSFVFTLILHSRAFKRLFYRSQSDARSNRSLPPSSSVVKFKKSKRYKKKNGSSSSRPFLIPEWSHAADGGGSGDGDSFPARVFTSTPRRPTSALLASPTDTTSPTKPRDLRLPSCDSASRPAASNSDELSRLADDILNQDDEVVALADHHHGEHRSTSDRALTPPSLMDQPESIPLKVTDSRTSSIQHLNASSHPAPEYASASPSPSKLIAIDSLPSSQSESSILQTAPHSRLMQSSSLCKPHAASEWCGISRSVQTELTSPFDSCQQPSEEASALRSEVVLRKRRGRAHRGRPFGGNRTSIVAPSSYATGNGSGNGRSRKCRSLILDEMLERSLFAEKRDDSFAGFDRSPPEYRELFKEIFATLKRTVDREMGRPPTPPMASSV